MAVCRRLGMEDLGPTSQYYDVELEHFRIVFVPVLVRL